MILRRLSTVALCVVVAAYSSLPRAADLTSGPTLVRDAKFGEVLFYFYQEDYFPAIVRLLAASKQSQLENHLDESDLLLGGLYLSYGHHLKAAEIFERLLADNVTDEVRDRTWFFLAKVWHQRGYLAESQQALSRIRDELPDPLEAERHMLQAQLYIANAQHDQAIALLSKWRGRDAWANYARFNLGVAMVRSGRVDDAADILDDLGRIDPGSEELSALRDKANLALGYAYLQAGQPSSAKSPLQRVRLDGPFSNKALLGVGWADAENDRYRKALVPWMELRDRDLLDPAVQEAMLAVPYAMAKLESISQAADYYLNAVEAFYEEANRIEDAIGRLQNGTILDEFLAQDPLLSTGWYWKIESLPDYPESRFLFHLMATHRFQEGLKNYRDLTFLWKNLDAWDASIDVYRTMLETRETAYYERLPRAEQNLMQANVGELMSRKNAFDARLDSIEENNDALALATEYEYGLWDEIAGIERNPALQAAMPEADEVRDKVRLLKGVMLWNLEKEFPARLWAIRKNLGETGEALVETTRLRRQVADSMRDEPLQFASFNRRVADLSPKIDTLKARIGVAMEQQRAFILGVAVDELRAQRQRLDTYTVQARFALAAIYDLAATATVDTGFESQ
ncbi:MAG: tetratricopeptide repeat protein [Woeseiaceae bacterium]|nr:tetratricopeptide repeat protein [Woeseiaceae bacterium]